MQLRSILVALALGASSAFMRPASVSRVTARFSVEDKLKEIVAEQLGVEQSPITPRRPSPRTSARTRSTSSRWS